MSVILVVQPDSLQGKVLHDVARRIGAELVIVDSTKRAIEAIGKTDSGFDSPERAAVSPRGRQADGAPPNARRAPPPADADAAAVSKGGRGQAAQVGLRVSKEADGAGRGRLRSRRHSPRRSSRNSRGRRKFALGRPQPAKMTERRRAAIDRNGAGRGRAAEPEPFAELEQFVATPFMPDPIVEARHRVAGHRVIRLRQSRSSVFDLQPPDSDPFVEPRHTPCELEPRTTNRRLRTDELRTGELRTDELRTHELRTRELRTDEPRTALRVPAIFARAASSDRRRRNRQARSSARPRRQARRDRRGRAVSCCDRRPSQTDAFDFSAALDRARIDAEERRAADIAQLQAESRGDS